MATVTIYTVDGSTYTRNRPTKRKADKLATDTAEYGIVVNKNPGPGEVFYPPWSIIKVEVVE